MALTKNDLKTLRNLKIPREQKVLIENYWSRNPDTSGEMLMEFVFKLIGLSIAGVLILTQFASIPDALVNLARFSIWFLSALLVFTQIGTCRVALFLERAGNEKILDRIFVNQLPNIRMPFQTYYWGLIALAVIVLTASLGYFLTTIMFLVTLTFYLAIRNGVKNSVTKTLQKLVLEAQREGGVAKIIDVTPHT